MSNSELFPQPDLTPEQKVAENARLRDIDDVMERRARQSLSGEGTDVPTPEEQKNALVERLHYNIPEYAQRLETELDPDFERAHNYMVSRITKKPSRLPFVNKEVGVYERVELAAWIIVIQIETHAGIILGRDGTLYGVPFDDLASGTFRPIDLQSISTEDLEKIEENLIDLIETREMI